MRRPWDGRTGAEPRSSECRPALAVTKHLVVATRRDRELVMVGALLRIRPPIRPRACDRDQRDRWHTRWWEDVSDRHALSSPADERSIKAHLPIKERLTAYGESSLLGNSDRKGASSGLRRILARMRDARVFRLASEPIASLLASGPPSDGLPTACGSASLNSDATLHAAV